MEPSRKVHAEQETAPEDGGAADWYVYEAIVADGSWSIGVLRGTPNREHVMVVEEALTRQKAEDMARRLARSERTT